MNKHLLSWHLGKTSWSSGPYSETVRVPKFSNFKPIELHMPVFLDFSGPLSSCHLKAPEPSILLQLVSPANDLYTVVKDGRPLPLSPQRRRLRVTQLASPRWHQNQDPSLPLAGQRHPTTVPASGGWAHSIWGHGFSVPLTNNNSLLRTPDGDSRDPTSALWLLAAPTTPKTSGRSLRWSTNPFPAYSTSYNTLFFPVSSNKMTKCIYPDTTSNTYFFWENNHLFPHNLYLFQCFELAAAFPARVLLFDRLFTKYIWNIPGFESFLWNPTQKLEPDEKRSSLCTPAPGHSQLSLSRGGDTCMYPTSLTSGDTHEQAGKTM